MKNIAVLICIVLFVSCNSKKSIDNQTSNPENNNTIDGQTNSNENAQYIIVKVSDRDSERIEKTNDFSPTELRTTLLNNGNLLTTFKAYLGSFDKEHFYDLNLSFIRKKQEKTGLETGTYHLVANGDGLKLQPKTDIFFESISTFNSDTFNNIKASGTIDDFPDEFYAPLSDKNILVITSAEKLIETENSTDIISEHFQRVKGYLVFNIIKIQSGKAYEIRVDFNIINEVRIPQKN